MQKEIKGSKLLELTANDAKIITGLKESAFKDYVAARILFLNNQLHQAAFFANTCIEKELKAILIMLGISCKVKHDTFKLLNLVRLNEKDTATKINQDFLKVISKIYESRYHERLNPGYNFVILKWKFLVELDYTYDLLEKKIRYKRSKQHLANFESPYEQDNSEITSFITDDNFLHAKLTKDIVLARKEFVYEFRILENHEVLEAFYCISKNIDLENFIFHGLLVSKDNKSFSVSHKPDNSDKSVMKIFRNGISQPLNIS